MNAGRGKGAKSLNPKLQVGVAVCRALQGEGCCHLSRTVWNENALSVEQELCSSAAGEAYGRNEHFLAANTAPDSMIISSAGLPGIAPKIKLDSRKLRP